MLLTIFLEAIIKIVFLSIVIHFLYLIIVKFALKKNSQDMLGGIVAKLFNDWLDVVGYLKNSGDRKNILNKDKNLKLLDRQYKLMLLIHILPASLLTALIWGYLIQPVGIITALYLVLMVFSTTRRN